MKCRSIPGINIQWPISALILSGEKVVETRRYPLPKKYIGIPLALLETPGKGGNFKTRITGVIKFKTPFKYTNKKEFYNDIRRHKVDEASPWRWQDDGEKWGWPLEVVHVFKKPIEAPKRRGLVFTRKCVIPKT